MTQNSFQLTSSSVSDRGLSEKRPQNEDSFLEMPNKGLFAVADGVGGAQAGDVASQMAMEMLGEAFTNLREGGDVEELMELAISRANGSIYQMSHDLPQLSTMATTIVALHVDGNIATIGHAGDSRLYRIDPRGQIFRETQDHSVVEEEVRAGRMTPEQAMYHPSKNVISRALGAEPTVEVDMKTIMFEPGTSFLLCSDGVTRHIPDNELQDLLHSGQALPLICEQIKNICYSRGAEDNLTAVVVKIESTGADADDDENTVATARPPLVNSAIISSLIDKDDDDEIETPTQNFQAPVESPREAVIENSAVPISTAAAAAVAEPSAQTATPSNQTVSNQPARETSAFSAHEDEPKRGGGFLNSFISAVLFLVIGLAAGAVGVYYWFKTQAKPEVPTITQVQSPDIPFSAFENNRRNVDKNPAQYITASGATAEDAEDYYLLGRAYLLTGKYEEAKGAFTKAKERLPMMSGNDYAMLANEISIGLASIDSPTSRKIIESGRTVETSSNTNANTAGNTNTNTATNTNN